MPDDHRPVSDDRTRFVFEFRFDPLFRLASMPFGVTPDHARVEVDDDRFVAVFGRWRVDTELQNVIAAEVTGPYWRPKVIGPARLSLRDGGLTFATNADQGVCIQFDEPVSGLLPVPWVRHPALTVTVAEPAVLATLLDRAHHDDRGSVDAEEVTAEDLSREVSDDLHALTAAELRDRARELGIDDVAKMKKAELIEALRPD